MKVRGLIAALGLFAFAGCGDAGPKLVPVSGTITLNGKPLEGAEIAFMPDASNKAGLAATDLSGPQGNFKVSTLNRSGAVPGKYKVKITKTPGAAKPDAAASDIHKEDPFMAQLGAESARDAAKGATVRKKEAVQEKVDQSFDREVTDAGGTMDFDVKSTTKAEAATTAAPK